MLVGVLYGEKLGDNGTTIRASRVATALSQMQTEKASRFAPASRASVPTLNYSTPTSAPTYTPALTPALTPAPAIASTSSYDVPTSDSGSAPAYSPDTSGASQDVPSTDAGTSSLYSPGGTPNAFVAPSTAVDTSTPAPSHTMLYVGLAAAVGALLYLRSKRKKRSS